MTSYPAALSPICAESSKFRRFAIFGVDRHDGPISALPVCSISLNIDRAAVVIVCNGEVANLVANLKPVVAGRRYWGKFATKPVHA